MKAKKYLWWILCTIVFFTTFSSCKVGRFIVYNFADINDYKKFPARTIEKGPSTFRFAETSQGRVPSQLNFDGEKVAFDEFLERNKTVAFLIIQRDTIQYEKYWDGYDKSAIVPSFSMAKSVTSILIGIAIEEGWIKSVDEPVTNYLPELKDEGFDQVTIEQVLQMTSGLKFNESYTNPFGDAATYYYGRDLEKVVRKMKLSDPPGSQFNYVSGNTQLLGAILDRALGERSISSYLEEKIWQPLGMEYDASWSLDKKDGMEKTFCCLNARAHDYAKIGRLYLNKGNWDGQQIVPADWVEQSTKVDTSNHSSWGYQYQWWLPTKNGDFMAHGILGQYIYVHPDKDLIFVRLGRKEGKVDWGWFLSMVAASY